MKVSITPRKPTELGSYACMPLKRNVPQGREDWTLTNCPECGAECWRLPMTEIVEQSGSVALCTMCALRKGT